MPNQKVDQLIAGKPVQFTLKTGGGNWKCQIHSNRAAYEKAAKAAETDAPATDSGVSSSSASSSGSGASTPSASH
ncbi:hypothetical protein F4780DRAFT_778744 [Xylariomycetidae sp. FL0641]|nr:hypothetical protein F4780DRAFT_778744 [Xylariomycetidae sp. FL0641]